MSRLTGKDPDAGKDCRQEEKGTTEDEMAGWHHRLSGHEFEQTLGDGEGQGSLACCSPRGCRESDMTEPLNSSDQLTLISLILRRDDPLMGNNQVAPHKQQRARRFYVSLCDSRSFQQCLVRGKCSINVHPNERI